MSHSVSRFKTVINGIVAAAALGAATLVAAPVQAQPSFNFQIEIPGQGGGAAQFGFGTGPTYSGPSHGGPRPGGWHDRDRWPGHHQQRCLTDREIRRGLQDNGYSNVTVSRELGRNRVSIEASYGNWVYSMRVDRCTGQVDRVERLHRTRRGGGWGWGHGY